MGSSKGPQGLVIYRGPSLITGAPVIVVLTGLQDVSSNTKTGAMLQTYILCADMSPIDAIRSGLDDAICGSCVHRWNPITDVRTCYVTEWRGPRIVYEAFQRGFYPDVSPARAAELTTGRPLRLGTYGDPVAVPFRVWSPLIKASSSHTGYTHQWRAPIGRQYRRILMASTDTVAELEDARARGWRSFRVRRVDESGRAAPLETGEIACPASIEAGKRTQCADCNLCGGSGRRARDIAIIAHDAAAIGARIRAGELERRDGGVKVSSSSGAPGSTRMTGARLQMVR